MSTEIGQAARVYNLAYNSNGLPSLSSLVHVDFDTNEVNATSSVSGTSQAEIFTSTAGPRAPIGLRTNRQLGPVVSWNATLSAPSPGIDQARTFARLSSLRTLVATIVASSGIDPSKVG